MRVPGIVLRTSGKGQQHEPHLVEWTVGQSLQRTTFDVCALHQPVVECGAHEEVRRPIRVGEVELVPHTHGTVIAGRWRTHVK
jgi:hypothetical protein